MACEKTPEKNGVNYAGTCGKTIWAGGPTSAKTLGQEQLGGYVSRMTGGEPPEIGLDLAGLPRCSDAENP